MFARPILATVLLAASLAPAGAQSADGVGDLIEALRLPEMVAIMRDEGLSYGDDIARDLFMGEADPDWSALVADIYDEDRMMGEVEAAFAEALDGTDVAPMIAFLTSEPGQSIVGYEVAARRALLDEDVEEAANEIAAAAFADRTDRFLQVERFVEVNDLIETNVVGAMNSNYAFYIGLLDGGAIPGQTTEDQILADVWAQEPEIRSNTTEWVYGFLLTAYAPVSDDELEAYIAFSETDAGQGLNAALFSAFDGVFENISRALGLGAARFMAGQDI